ncbi:MAG: hypothetical protein COW30_10655 [Rhodospirillales bacterium CG15_BIG_FIL_POST_REV_8_21_14_020_66_15]|nr:MAG: hypothetical protein COW30_10655 [Rhodospirillales bacterium CG15_BIG_FIL_POST_REV_8_21_14_020_66_15]
MRRRALTILFLSILAIAWTGPGIGVPALADGNAPEPPPAGTAKMTVARLAELIGAVGDDVQSARPGVWSFKVENTGVTVIVDEKADRMRILTAIAKTEQISAELYYRMMQANFDSALDARYAVAKGILWSAFIHPLGRLSDAQFLAGIGQTVNLAKTFGTSFTSGGLVFGGGDSAGLQARKLIDKLLKKGLDI